MINAQRQSSPRTSNVWLDITTAASWSRAPVGIVRAEVEFARFLAERFPATSRFCIFSGLDLAFHEISLRDCLSLIGDLQRPVSGGTLHRGVQTAKRPQVRGVLRSAFEAIASRVPRSAKQWLKRCSTWAFQGGRFSGSVHKVDNSAERTACQTTSRHRALNGLQFNLEISHQSTNPFSQSDVFVSMGLDWDQKDFCAVSEIRRKFGLRMVWVCYDLIPIKLPHLCSPGVSAKFSEYFKNVARVADKILCISVSTSNDLAEYLTVQKCSAPHLSVIHLGCTLPTSNVYNFSQEINSLLGSKYLLYVSTIERRKNHETLYRAYVQLIESGVTDLPPLVFVGMHGWGVSDFLKDLELDHRVKDKIILLTDVSDNNLATLYRASYLTLYPSLYEGWGLPVAESLAFGKFCLASNSSSIPEVGGGLLEYIDPWDVPSWANRILYFIMNPTEVQKREEAIRQEYRAHTWGDSGASIYAACANLIDSADFADRCANC